VPYSVASPPPTAAPRESQPVFCSLHAGSDGLNRTLAGSGISLQTLTTYLSRNYASALNRTVIDKTMLNGTFDVHLKWAVDNPASLAGPDTALRSDPAGPSIFTALQEQLGLKLESAKGPVEVLVIDHVERPVPN